MRRFLFLVLLLGLNSSSLAVTASRGPWIDHVLLPIYEGEFGYDYFNGYKLGSHKKHESTSVLSFDNALYFALSPDFALELEVDVARTKKNAWILASAKESCNYVIWDDARGDPFAFSLWGAIAEVPTVALNDPALFHLGNFEGEFELRVGKEWSWGAEWTYRCFGGVSVLGGSRGNLGGKGLLAYQYKCFSHLIEFRGEGYVGGGSRCLHLDHFKGYGPLAYRFIDLFASYSYLCEYGNEFKLELLSRVFSHNSPSGNLGLRFEWTLPFNF